MSKESSIRLIDEDKIPGVTRINKWLQIFKQIPAGKAWVTTNKELEVSPSYMSYMVRRLVRSKQLPASFRVLQRKDGDRIMIYVVNSTNSS